MRRQPSNRTRQLLYISIAASVFSLILYSYKSISSTGVEEQLSQGCSNNDIQIVDSGLCEQIQSPVSQIQLSSTR
ncbi:MAG: hypothetical protein OEZ43_16135 [Gammaproteobacteria bacterium]|nr:hypothetical protein [Gammaproteobacteria bacterium]